MGLIYKSHNLSITGPLIKSCVINGNVLNLKVKEESMSNEQLVLRNNYGIEVKNQNNVKLISFQVWYPVTIVSVEDNNIFVNLK